MTLHDLPHPGVVCPDVAMLHCSPPDAHGFCTLGTSVDWARGAAEHAQVVGDGNGDGIVKNHHERRQTERQKGLYFFFWKDLL